MGVRRSLDSAWALYCIEYSLQNSTKVAPGKWGAWCSKWKWVSRCEARADYLAAQEFEALESEMRELAKRRQRREINRQATLERAGEKMGDKFDKLMELPNVSIEDEKFDAAGKVVSRRKVTALRPGEIAKFTKAWADLEAIAIHGHVHVSKTIRVDDAPAEASGQSGTAEFIPTPPPEEKE
jgi:hypothetical protein